MIPSRDRDKIAAQLDGAQRRINELEAELRRTQSRDPLVGSLLTLPAFRAQLELDVQRAHRYGRPLALAVLDIDGFGELNRTRGFGTGDMVLVAIGSWLSARTRAHDLPCRAGADEFAVLLPETEAGEAKAVIDRLLVELEDIEAGDVRGISISAGIASLAEGSTPEQLLSEAAVALEHAREEGGGRSVLARAATLVHEGGETPSPATVDAVFALAQTLEERDRYTSEHSESVVGMTERVAEAMALGASEVALIRTAALLHDIGKVGVPDSVLHKNGPLDDNEWVIMREHPVIGERILRAVPGMGQVARIVRHEHERWDGGGYPDGLSGDDIPVGARVILACDAYHAMTSDRPYRKGMPHADAISELTANAGSQFDPRVAEALVGYLFGRRQAGLTAA